MLDFGAVGDATCTTYVTTRTGRVCRSWAGTDDTAAIQSAIDSLPGHRGRVFVPEGTYLVSAPIEIHGSGISIEGVRGSHVEGVSRIANASTRGRPAIIITPRRSASDETYVGAEHLQGITISGLSVEGTPLGGDGLWVFNAAIRATEVTLYGNGRDGVHIRFGWISSFNAVTFQNNGRHGVFSDNSLNAVAFRDCAFLGHWNAHGVHLVGGLPVVDVGEPAKKAGGTNAVLFDTCDWEGNGVAMYLVADYGLKDITVLNNNFESNRDYAVYQVGPTDFDSFKVIGSTFAQGKGQKVYLETPRAASSYGMYFAGGSFRVAAGREFLHFSPFVSGGEFNGRTVEAPTPPAGSRAADSSSLPATGRDAARVRTDGLARNSTSNDRELAVEVSPSAGSRAVLTLGDATDWVVTIEDPTVTSLQLSVAFGPNPPPAGQELELRVFNRAGCPEGRLVLPSEFRLVAPVRLPAPGKSTTLRFRIDASRTWWEVSRSANAG